MTQTIFQAKRGGGGGGGRGYDPRQMQAGFEGGRGSYYNEDQAHFGPQGDGYFSDERYYGGQGGQGPNSWYRGGASGGIPQDFDDFGYGMTSFSDEEVDELDLR